MPAINVTLFAGERPRIAAHQLPNENATIARNAFFDIGTLRPYRGLLDTQFSVPTTVKTLYRYLDAHWLYWNHDVDVVKSPIDQDPWDRVYFTGDGFPKVTNNTIVQGDGPPINFRLGVPAPVDKVVAVVNPPSPLPEQDDPDDDETRFYVYTWVTANGEEGPPSPLSNQLEIQYPSSTVDLTLPAMGTQTSNITTRRIYRSATGGGVAGFFKVADLDPAQDQFTDSLTVSQLGDQIESEGYEMPDDAMINLTQMPNGILSGTFGNTVCFSEPFLPHAWNPRYRLTTEYDIVATAAVGNTLVVATEGYPEVFQGVSPDAMSGRKLSSKLACVSKRSMRNIDNMIVYASPSGLAAFNGTDVVLVTDAILTKEQWEALEPETIEGHYYDGNYVAFYGQDHDKAFIFNPTRQDLVFFDIGSDAAYELLVSGELYLKKPDGTLALWDAGPNLDVTFRSKEFRNLYPTFSTLYVLSEDNSRVGLRIFADGQLVHDYIPSSIPDKPFRIPPARGNTWQFEAYGDVEVTRVTIATSVAEVYG